MSLIDDIRYSWDNAEWQTKDDIKSWTQGIITLAACVGAVVGINAAMWHYAGKHHYLRQDGTAVTYMAPFRTTWNTDLLRGSEVVSFVNYETGNEYTCQNDLGRQTGLNVDVVKTEIKGGRATQYSQQTMLDTEKVVLKQPDGSVDSMAAPGKNSDATYVAIFKQRAVACQPVLEEARAARTAYIAAKRQETSEARYGKFRDSEQPTPTIADKLGNVVGDIVDYFRR